MSSGNGHRSEAAIGISWGLEENPPGINRSRTFVQRRLLPRIHILQCGHHVVFLLPLCLLSGENGEINRTMLEELRRMGRQKCDDHEQSKCAVQTSNAQATEYVDMGCFG